MPLSAAHRAVLENAEAAGCGDLDNSAIINVRVAPGRDRGPTSRLSWTIATQPG
jgi:hypothetical protein